jgi:glycosyltransferase involved in cell wall biosynthesis
MLANRQLYKILVITPEYPPFNTGGGGLAFQSLCEQLNKMGHKMTILTGDHVNSGISTSPKGERVGDLNVIRLPLLPHILNILKAKTPPNFNSIKSIKNVVMDNSFDFTLIFGAFEGLSVTSAKICMRAKIPYFIYSHGYPNIGNYPFPINTFFKFYEKFSLLKMFDNAKQVFSVNPQQVMPVKTTYIPNGIDFEKFIKIENVINIRQKFQIPENNLIIFSLGRLTERKGYQYVLEAIKDIPNVTYILGGEDYGYKNVLENFDKNLNTIFVGKLTEDERKNYFQQCDIYISPSLEEFFGLTILEAMAFKKPIIATKIGGAIEMVKENENGFLFEPKDVSTLKDRILKLKTEIELRNRFGIKSEEVAKQYSWETVSDQIISLIEKSL